jgi:pyruvate kinase
MISEPTAHRQDAEDVTSGVLEGIDAFILSHETSVGKHPIDAVVQLAKCIAEGENILDYEQVYNEVRADAVTNAKKLSPADALATTACSIALDNNVDLFVCLTESGRIARYIAKYRPFQPIIACSTSTAVVHQANMTRGVIGYKIPTHLKNRSDKLIALILKVAKEQGMCMPGNKVLIFNAEQEGKKGE